MKSSGVIYRLGRVPDPWAVPDWASAGPDGTFGNRFDDPDATYRVLYTSSQRLGCFLETLARFRIDHFPLGEVPMEWLRKTSSPSIAANSAASLGFAAADIGVLAAGGGDSQDSGLVVCGSHWGLI